MDRSIRDHIKTIYLGGLEKYSSSTNFNDDFNVPGSGFQMDVRLKELSINSIVDGEFDIEFMTASFPNLFIKFNY